MVPGIPLALACQAYLRPEVETDVGLTGSQSLCLALWWVQKHIIYGYRKRRSKAATSKRFVIEY